ncbi:carcinoembryonic antigen-related cell adhesion molecule 5-like [Gigantopelta aegis]|uniref:carcinoembryonic antigen-related cell adhesion molecule 5-like n=1 Tax=Gigantopelta aegis TaxID=1735272 RepID=UPI001B88D89D|nr:carcinoembryonic antigen-related cell adhesion molecule 5-like [Gigantopelta aegis]
MYGPQNVALDPASPGNVTEGDSLNVSCTAQCNPSPCSFSWALGNNGVLPGALLPLPDISINKNGSVYTCTVNNTAIPRSTTIQFTLTVKPKMKPI